MKKMKSVIILLTNVETSNWKKLRFMSSIINKLFSATLQDMHFSPTYIQFDVECFISSTQLPFTIFPQYNPSYDNLGKTERLDFISYERKGSMKVIL